MKIMTGATLAALAFGFGLASTPVYAQYAPDNDRGRDATQQRDQNDKDEHRDRRRDNRGDRDNANQPPAPTPNANDGRSDRHNTDFDNNNNRRDRSFDRDRRDNDRFDNDRRDRRDRDWNRRGRDVNFNINVYRRNITSPRRYRHGTFHYPRGYNYRRWHHGQRLPVVFYRDRDYWLLDFVAFGLFAPPPGYVWVRYGPDALLIDTYTGEIIQVRYDVFYS